MHGQIDYYSLPPSLASSSFCFHCFILPNTTAHFARRAKLEETKGGNPLHPTPQREENQSQQKLSSPPPLQGKRPLPFTPSYSSFVIRHSVLSFSPSFSLFPLKNIIQAQLFPLSHTDTNTQALILSLPFLAANEV